MRRPVLVSTVSFGLALSLAAFAGVFAVFSDQASTGQNDVTSAALPNAVGNPKVAAFLVFLPVAALVLEEWLRRRKPEPVPLVAS